MLKAKGRLDLYKLSPDLWNSVTPRSRLPNQNQTTNFSTYFLYNESINTDRNKQNLQMAMADFKSSVYKAARKAVLAYNTPLSILSD